MSFSPSGFAPDAPSFDILMTSEECSVGTLKQLVYEPVIEKDVETWSHTCSGGVPNKHTCVKCFALDAFKEGFTIGRAVGYKQ